MHDQYDEIGRFDGSLSRCADPNKFIGGNLFDVAYNLYAVCWKIHMLYAEKSDLLGIIYE